MPKFHGENIRLPKVTRVETHGYDNPIVTITNEDGRISRYYLFLYRMPNNSAYSYIKDPSVVHNALIINDGNAITWDGILTISVLEMYRYI